MAGKSDAPPLKDQIKAGAEIELEYIRKLGSSRNLILASENLGAYEALLMLVNKFDEGLPVYELITSIQSRFSSLSGIIKRIRIMRDSGLIEDHPGPKRSQVYLRPSNVILKELGDSSRASTTAAEVRRRRESRPRAALERLLQRRCAA
jgi:hypothetical protein